MCTFLQILHGLLTSQDTALQNYISIAQDMLQSKVDHPKMEMEEKLFNIPISNACILFGGAKSSLESRGKSKAIQISEIRERLEIIPREAATILSMPQRLQLGKVLAFLESAQEYSIFESLVGGARLSWVIHMVDIL